MNTWECLWAGVRLVLIGRTMCGDAWGKPLTRIECTGPNFIHTFSLITLSRRTYTAMHYDSNLMANQVLTRYPTPFFFLKKEYTFHWLFILEFHFLYFIFRFTPIRYGSDMQPLHLWIFFQRLRNGHHRWKITRSWTPADSFVVAALSSLRDLRIIIRNNFQLYSIVS